MRFVILHYHILKNAGSTIEEMLESSFGDRFHRYDTPAREGTVSPDELLSFVEANPRLQALSSHHIRYPLPSSRNILFFDICFLRDPVDRVRSMYDYFRKRPAPGDPISDLANRSAPGEFMRGMVADHSLHIANVQVNLLAQAGDSDKPTQADLAIARDRILKASFPGVVDLFDESAAAGEYFLRAAFPAFGCAVPAANVSREPGSTLESRIGQVKNACDSDVFRRLMEMNALDFELLDCARQEVMRRFHLIPKERPMPAPPGLLTSARRLIEGRALFDAAFYLDRNPDVRRSGMNPLLHYLRYGAREGRKPHPWFDPEFYLAGCDPASRAEAAANPLLHFLRRRAASPHPLWDIDAAGGGPCVSRPGGPLIIGDVPFGDNVLISEDAEGRMQFTAPAPQRRFLQAANLGQIRALLNS